MSRMDTQREQAPGSLASRRSVLVTQLLAGVVFLGIAVIHLVAADPTGWDRFIGGSAALVSGLNLGAVVGSLSR